MAVPLNAGASANLIPGLILIVHVRPLSEISGIATAVLGTTRAGDAR